MMSQRGRRALILLAVTALVLIAASIALAQQEDQVSQGQAVYNNFCASCHQDGVFGPDLTAPVLTGYDTAHDLFDFASTQMPQNAPGSLEDQQYWDVIAFLLGRADLLPAETVVGPDTAAEITLASAPSPQAQDDTAQAEALWQELEAAGYAENWELTGKGELYRGEEPHGALLTTYLDEAAYEVMQSQPGEFPDGATLVKENYMPDETLAAITVMRKQAGYDPRYGDWFWARYAPDGEVQAAGQVEGCVACHGAVSSNDYVFTFPLAPAEAVEVEPTDQDIQAAEELWQALQDDEYTDSWQTMPNKGELYAGQHPHGALLTTYLDEMAFEALQSLSGPLPDGATIVKENYMPDETLAAITVMQKQEGDWFWARYGADGEVQAAGQPAGCVACHAAVSSNDDIFTFPVELIHVGTMQASELFTGTNETAAANRVEVELTEWEINMPASIPAGLTVFEVTNTGNAVHNFEIEGQGIEQVFEANLQSGESGTLEVDLEPGTYRVYCPVGNHAGRGMELELTVTEADAGSGG